MRDLDTRQDLLKVQSLNLQKVVNSWRAAGKAGIGSQGMRTERTCWCDKCVWGQKWHMLMWWMCLRAEMTHVDVMNLSEGWNDMLMWWMCTRAKMTHVDVMNASEGWNVMLMWWMCLRAEMTHVDVMNVSEGWNDMLMRWMCLRGEMTQADVMNVSETKKNASRKQYKFAIF